MTGPTIIIPISCSMYTIFRVMLSTPLVVIVLTDEPISWLVVEVVVVEAAVVSACKYRGSIWQSSFRFQRVGLLKFAVIRILLLGLYTVMPSFSNSTHPAGIYPDGAGTCVWVVRWATWPKNWCSLRCPLVSVRDCTFLTGSNIWLTEKSTYLFFYA